MAKNKLKPRVVGNFVEIAPGRWRDIKLAKELELEKRYGFNWRTRQRQAMQKAHDAPTENAAENVAPVELPKPETTI